MYGIRTYNVEVALNDKTSVLNFKKIYLLLQKLLGGGGETQNGDLASLILIFKESRLKTGINNGM
jgi:hypothetical protein